MSHNRIKKQYDRKVLATFDLIGCYFIDTVYNDLFLKAKHQFTIGGAKSLTDVYRSYVIWYMQGVSEKPKNYIEIMKKFLEYYNKQTNTVTATLAELENKILSQFIPPEYYQDFNNANKEQTLHSIIIKAINQLGEVVLESHMLGRIIDDHLNAANVQILQEKMTDIFISQREEYYSKFVNAISKNNGNTTVSRDQFKKLKDAYAEEVKKRVAAEADRDKALQLLQASLKKISELEANNNVSAGSISAGSISAGNVGTNNVVYPTDGAVAYTKEKQNTPQRVYTPTRNVTPVRNVTQNTTPVRKPDINSSQSVKSPQNTVGSVGLKLSDLTIDDHMLAGVTKSEAAPTEEERPEISEEAGDNTEDSDESGDDSEEIHKKQKAALSNRNAEFTLGLEDDPGFGN